MSSFYQGKQKIVKNGRVQEVEIWNFPSNYSDENKMYHMVNHGVPDREAYKIAFRVSEAEMQRIEND